MWSFGEGGDDLKGAEPLGHGEAGDGESGVEDGFGGGGGGVGGEPTSVARKHSGLRRAISGGGMLAKPSLLDLDPSDFPDWKTPFFSASYGSRPWQTAGARRELLVIAWLAAVVNTIRSLSLVSTMRKDNAWRVAIGEAGMWVEASFWSGLSILLFVLAARVTYWHLYKKIHARTGWHAIRHFFFLWPFFPPQ